jgi:hypothetical protein
MKIAVTDANIFIDLIKLQWLGYLFSIDIEIYTSREIIDELNDSQLERITAFVQSRQLAVHSFSSEELEEIHTMKAPSSLTVEDKSVVYLAKKVDSGVLSGDNPLKKYCLTNGLEVRGIIWLFDKFLEFNLVTYEMAIKQMNFLLSFNNRLPESDCQARLKEWRAKQ